MSDKLSLYERIVHRFFGDIIERAVNAAVSVRVDDSAGWEMLSGGGPHDRPWSDLRKDLDDAFDGWRKNFMVRRLVTLSRSYVVSGGIEISSKRPDVEKFTRRFWTYRKTRMTRRLGPMCDELTRAGEIFPVLHTNKIDGLSYVRFVPASRIRSVKADPDDYEKELAYGQLRDLDLTAKDKPDLPEDYDPNLKWWFSPDHPLSNTPGDDGRLPPVMLHFAVNKPIGATRGEGDLTPILKWCLRYANWLEDRVRLNRIRTRSGILHIRVADDQVDAKRKQYTRQDPLKAGILVTGMNEEAEMLNLNIRASDAAPDGQALRLAIAAGSNTALHYMGEGLGANYSTAKEMGEPTTRFYSERQDSFVDILKDIVTIAYQRYLLVKGRQVPRSWDGDLKLEESVTEVARADNAGLAAAAKDIVTALAVMKAQSWIDDATAIRLAFKFAGEVIGEDEINHILSQPPPDSSTEQEQAPDDTDD